jgi:hypothetical protein
MKRLIYLKNGQSLDLLVSPLKEQCRLLYISALKKSRPLYISALKKVPDIPRSKKSPLQ